MSQPEQLFRGQCCDCSFAEREPIFPMFIINEEDVSGAKLNGNFPVRQEVKDPPTTRKHPTLKRTQCIDTSDVPQDATTVGKMETCASEGPNAENKQNHQNTLRDNLNHQISLGTKMAPAYSSHYRNILTRSSKIWREVKHSQDSEGHVDARKMAALKLFL